MKLSAMQACHEFSLMEVKTSGCPCQCERMSDCEFPLRNEWLDKGGPGQNQTIRIIGMQPDPVQARALPRIVVAKSLCKFVVH